MITKKQDNPDLIEYSRAPNEHEIKFGYGARVYTYIPRNTVTKKDGTLKSKVLLNGEWWTLT